MNDRLNHYQLTYLLSSLLDEKGAAEIRQKIKEMIEKKEGQAGEEKIMNNNLAYPIKKQGQAVFLNLSFQSLPESIEELKKQLKLENHILRYMIQKKSVSASKKRREKPLFALPETELESDIFTSGLESPARDKELFKKPIGAPTAQAKTRKPETGPQKEKVKLEELDKKLEEILNE
ncbi:MAG: 30S ribosomal protein S6 [Candidatus Portnoybacteria bacterium RIFCSPLOWO2_12_FULL_39_9]|uniref:Small ribosomal subunit protein bS6 n=1 Tax=Candidatus Portnoybacteria bacterium RIFCSPHIGHO2_12_FULL_38_9 TaxID=1801997 RepID=A0A1G2FFJ7_9BACT|nr:MAG: 30S ribosomal protein S6 [Candidatus Portnoybacteria bacterium RBG_13_40_8]OGZ35667.1 MAG: 30S ribosomal protein S6 [Candidatus Portnoybacteria bacterium RIFCSPHIGHO2_02_FULL_39_12]OGZ36321.1 MAG: 30S ribosomal protein S6 [Candidatus Portnoybacteria bacterium RIFCSPHIGHO2_12_FULL_38_9]OGZ40784.1 MAG: 30S ribosomal protein S6 [Candidatus Portnoybacteria bacterium RIFCSPLOWO2_12_FULL_39_9]